MIENDSQNEANFQVSLEKGPSVEVLRHREKALEELVGFYIDYYVEQLKLSECHSCSGHIVDDEDDGIDEKARSYGRPCILCTRTRIIEGLRF